MSEINIGEKIKDIILFLQERRKGYKYHINIGYSVKNNKFFACVIGESMVDKSHPHDFVSCEVDDFNDLPDIIKNKAVELLNQEIAKNKEIIDRIQESNKKLAEEFSLIQRLSSLNN